MSKKIRERLTYVVEGASFGSAGDTGQQRLAVREELDAEGRPVAVTTYDNRGAEQERTIKTYDSQGRQIEEVTNDVLTGSFDKHTTTYNDALHTVEEIQFYGEDPGERAITKSNAEGQTLDITRFDADGELQSRHVFGYDEKGHCILDEEYEADVLAKRTVTAYTDAGVMARQKVTFEQSPGENHTVVYEYTAQQDVSEARAQDDSVMWREVTKRDANGKPLETVMEHAFDPTQSNRRVWEYDDGGRTTLVEQYNDSNQLDYRIQVDYTDGLATEEATFYSAAYRGVAMHIIRRFSYEFYD